MSNDYPYNDDLLIVESDQAQARSEFPLIANALIFPNLVAAVSEADSRANSGKKWVWRRGVAAVFLVTVSLVMASATPLYAERHPWSEVSAIVAAILGVIGSVLAIINRQQKWLEHRLVTEGLRQFHFKYLIETASEIVASANSNNFDEYCDRREIALNKIKKDLVARRSGMLSAILDDPESPNDIMKSPLDLEIFETEAGAQILKAYRELRILRQKQFADHKLIKSGAIFSKFSRDQAEKFAQISIILIAFLLFVHIGSALFITIKHEEFNRWLEFLGLCIALIALALRAIEEGLKPKAEVERYRHYQSASRRALEEFDEGETRSKLEAAKSLERAAYDELAIFLKSHEEAGFKM